MEFFIPSNRTTRTGRIKGLDGFNEIIAANRINRQVGAKQERENLHNVMTFALAAKVHQKFKPIEGKAHVHIEVIEPNNKRDVSNLFAVSKYVLDGITRPRGKKPGAGLIVDDSQKYCECTMSHRVIPGQAGAIVKIESVE